MRSSRVLGVVAAVLLTGTVTACGGGDESSSSGFCDAAEKFVAAQDEGDGILEGDAPPTPEAAEAAFVGVGEAIADMASGAPDEIKADIDMVAATMTDFIALLEGAGWNFEAAATDPEFVGISDAMTSADMEAAQDRVDAYAQSECDVTLGS